MSLTKLNKQQLQMENRTLTKASKTSKQRFHKLRLNFHIQNNFNVISPNLKALNLSGLNF